MDLIALNLVLIAALLHAVWNAMMKRSGDRALTMAFINTGHLIFGVVLVLLYAPPAQESWIYLALSTIIHFFYYGLLLLSYRLGDLSQVYPIARGIAPALVAVGSYLLLGETLPFNTVFGIVCVCGGIFMLYFGDRKTGINTGAVYAALATGVTIAAYSVADGLGVRQSGSPIGYIGWLFVLEGISIIFLFWYRRNALPSMTPMFVLTGLSGGIISAIAYGLAIYAMSLTELANVSAIRESSVIMAALIGVLWLGERPWKLRVFASVVVAIGIIFIASSG